MERKATFFEKTQGSNEHLFLSISDVHNLEKVLTAANDDALVVFDVDWVILDVKEPIFRARNLVKHKKIISQLKENYTKQEFEILEHRIIVQNEFVILNQQLAEIVKNIQSKHIPTLACTGLLTGRIDSVPDMMEWRTEQLNNVGIDFSKAAPEDITFQSIEFPKYNNSTPQYKNGVMLTNGLHGPTHKGSVLTALINSMHKKPKQIIMVDDNRNNLEDIQNSLNKIAFKGNYTAIEFTAAQHAACPLVTSEEFEQTLNRYLGSVANFYDF